MIVGVDISSHRIDLAWLENGRPQRWHQELAKGHLIDRLRSIRVEWPRSTTHMGEIIASDVQDVAIEMPFGQSRSSVAALMSVVGVVTRQAPPWARVAWPSSGELRAAIGARNTKDSAHFKLRLLFANPDQRMLEGWDEHELDALTACTGWQKILEKQDAA